MTDEGEVQKPGKFWVYEQIIRIPWLREAERLGKPIALADEFL